MRGLICTLYRNIMSNQPRGTLYFQYCHVSDSRNVKVLPAIKYSKMRTHTCGELNVSNVGQKVLLCGWLHFQRFARFGVLRDGYGSTQVIVPENRKDIIDTLKRTPLESVISVSGVVEKRPEEQVRKNTATGEIEVVVNDLTIVNAAQKLPFSIRNYKKASEYLRMKYRYLDLRYPQMQKNLRERSKLLMRMRNFLANEENFVEVETPTLFKKTPGGAREYIVPTKFAGEFYSLVQSPQQFKQLLMVGSLDKYFQVARCYRDETARPDRQPEFTQMDIEMSFCTAEDIMDLVENMLVNCWPTPLTKPFLRMSYSDALNLYGTDQPDISFNCTFFDVKQALKNDNRILKGVKIHQASVYFNNLIKKELSSIAKEIGAHLDVLQFEEQNLEKIKTLLSKFNIDMTTFIREHSIETGDLVLLSSGVEQTKVLKTLGKCRIMFLRGLHLQGFSGNWESHHKGKFLWVTDFPLFEIEDGSLKSMHHPFTAPHPEDRDLLQTNPLQVRGLHYDLVLDGYEVGGGSVRVHEPELQSQILSMLKIPDGYLQHLIEALQSGAPPHAGIALGIDRLVSIMVGAHTIREVIAFPKTVEGKDPMSGAPTTISEEDLNYYKIKVEQQPEIKEK